MTPQQRSRKMLAEAGYLVETVERWNAFARRRVDLLGFADLLAVDATDTIAIQVTGGGNLSHRLKKITGLEAALTWARGLGRSIVIHDWRKVGKRGERKRWECRERIVTLNDFMAT